MTPRAATTLISPRETARLASLMPAETILVSPLSCVEATIEDARVGHLVTLINGETLVNTPPSIQPGRHLRLAMNDICLLYTSDAADDSLRVDLGGRRIIKKKIF